MLDCSPQSCITHIAACGKSESPWSGQLHAHSSLEVATQDNHAAGCSANMVLEGVRNKLSMPTSKRALHDLVVILGCSTRVV